MKRVTKYGVLPLFLLLLSARHAFAQTTTSTISTYTSDTINIITLIASSASVFFLIKGGYHYISSTGHPEAVAQAKGTIRNALVGLVLVLGSAAIISLLKGAVNPVASGGGASSIPIAQIEAVKPSGGLAQVLIDAVAGFMQNIAESATKPIVNGIIGYLTTTPTLLTNQTILNFWLVIVGITDSLFVIIVALLGLHFMSASTFGYEEVQLSRLLPRIGLAFLGANTSLFLANYVIVTANVLVKTVLDATGGLSHALAVDAINPSLLISPTNSTSLIILIFLVLFVMIAIVLLLMYISRLIVISLGVVLSPLIFLLMIIPKFSDLAEIAVKSYIVTVFMVFVHVVIIQLASSFLVLPSQSGNSLVALAVAIGLFLTLLKVPSLMMEMVFYTSANRAFKHVSHQILNVMSITNRSSGSRHSARHGDSQSGGRKATSP